MDRLTDAREEREGRGMGREKGRRKKGAPGEKKDASQVWWFDEELDRKSTLPRLPADGVLGPAHCG